MIKSFVGGERQLRALCASVVKRYNHRDTENTVKKKNKLRAFRASVVKMNNHRDAENTERKKKHRDFCASVVNKKTS